MADTMTPARFSRLLDAYGAEARRWPAEERDAALAFLREQVGAAALLDAAGAIDDLLLSQPSPAPSPALRAAVLAAAPRDPPLRRRLKLGWTALALGLAGAGGMLAGSAATAALAPAGIVLPAEEHEGGTVFGEAPVDAEV